MSPAGTHDGLIIETRRTVRAKSASLKNHVNIRDLSSDLGATDGDDPGAFGASRPRNLSRPGADRDVPFRHSAGAPRLNAAFVAQLLGQATPDPAQPLSSALAAYQQGPAAAPVCDRRL